MTKFERLYTAQRYREVRKILRGNPPLPPPLDLEEDSRHLFSAGSLGVCIVMALVLFIGGCLNSKPAHADCSNLSPQLQKAYSELKRVSNGDFTVSCRRING